MDMSQSTPSWLIGLFIIFALATAVTFGMFLYRHSEKAGLREQYLHLQSDIRDLRAYSKKIEGEVPLFDAQVQNRHTLATSLANHEVETRNDVDRMVAENIIRLKAITDDIDKEIKTYQEKLKEAKDRRAELGQEEQRALANERDFDNRRNQLRAKIEAVSQEIEKIKTEGRHQSALLDLRIAELEERIAELTRQRAVTGGQFQSDGQVMRAQANEGWVVINIGQKHNLRKGTRFTVYSRRGGKLVVKGLIEVVNVEEQIATARVTDEADANDPIVANDDIANPIYDPKKVKGFAIRGDFMQFSKDELKRFIVESGGRYDDEMTVNTDYLVAGGNSDAALQQATKLGISILSEEQLIDSQLFRLSKRIIEKN